MTTDLAIDTWYNIEFDIDTRIAADYYTVTVTDADGNLVDSSDSCQYWSDNPGLINKIRFWDDGQDDDIIYLDNIKVESE